MNVIPETRRTQYITYVHLCYHGLEISTGGLQQAPKSILRQIFSIGLLHMLI